MRAQQSTTDSLDWISIRWPHIVRFLNANRTTGGIEGDYVTFLRIEQTLTPDEQAVAFDEWADFYEWRLERRLGMLGDNRVERHLVSKWTDSMIYTLRRCAAMARGESPGEWIPQSLRRPDLHAEQESIVTDIVDTAKPANGQPDRVSSSASWSA